jgi:hypothetical protein
MKAINWHNFFSLFGVTTMKVNLFVFIRLSRSAPPRIEKKSGATTVEPTTLVLLKKVYLQQLLEPMP